MIGGTDKGIRGSVATIRGSVVPQSRYREDKKAAGILFTILETVYIGCPKQALVLARSGDPGDYEIIRKIVLAL